MYLLLARIDLVVGSLVTGLAVGDQVALEVSRLREITADSSSLEKLVSAALTVKVDIVGCPEQLPLVSFPCSTDR